MFLAFGEIMARIAPPGQLRWRQVLPGAVNVTWGGGEANVCASLAMLGQEARYLTALPRTPIAEAIAGTLRGLITVVARDDLKPPSPLWDDVDGVNDLVGPFLVRQVLMYRCDVGFVVVVRLLEPAGVE